MSFNEEELKNHCAEIIKDPAIRNRIVVLCEGDTTLFKQTIHAPRIKEFSQITQDSAFYHRAIPTWWRNIRKPEPSFFICGTQANVIKAYIILLETHQKNPENSYLNPDKLFALLDMDLQKLKLPKEYSFSNLEAIYENLYFNGQVNQELAKNHKIWVTGLIHKEAYFFISCLQDLFDKHQPNPVFKKQPLKLETIYQEILAAMSNDSDIQNNFTRAINRITHHEKFKSCKSIDEFQVIWKSAFNSDITDFDKDKLIDALLTVAKSKLIWEKIVPNTAAKNADIKTYRDDLSLIIAREFYAKQPRDSEHHLPGFFNALSALQ